MGCVVVSNDKLLSMKYILLTTSLILGATALSAEPLKGDDAINIIENGKIIMQRVAEPDEVTPTGYKAVSG